MDQISIEVKIVKSEDGRLYSGIDFQINGISLIELARNYERPFAEKEGHADLAGAYALLPLSEEATDVLRVSTADPEDKMVIACCSCGESGCWPLQASVTLLDEQVVWSEFEQPHRSTDSAAGHWSYEGFGPFIFQRDQYEQEVDKLV